MPASTFTRSTRQRPELAGAQAAVRAEEDRGAVAVVDRAGERVHLLGGQEVHLLAVAVRRQIDAARTASATMRPSSTAWANTWPAVSVMLFTVDGASPEATRPATKAPRVRWAHRADRHRLEERPDVLLDPPLDVELRRLPRRQASLRATGRCSRRTTSLRASGRSTRRALSSSRPLRASCSPPSASGTSATALCRPGRGTAWYFRSPRFSTCATIASSALESVPAL